MRNRSSISTGLPRSTRMYYNTPKKRSLLLHTLLPSHARSRSTWRHHWLQFAKKRHYQQSPC